MAPVQSTLTGETPDIRIYTIGYGGRTFEGFMQALATNGVTKLIDVRSYPETQRFGRSFFQRELRDNYKSIPKLGGYGYSAHQYKDWREKLNTEYLRNLIKLAAEQPIALMCAERNHLKCHRSYFIARALKEEYGIEIQHI